MRCLVPYIEGFRFSRENRIQPIRDSRLAMLMQNAGVEVVPLRIGRIVPLPCGDDWIPALDEDDWLVFSSANGVHAFFWNADRLGVTQFPPCHIAAVGKKTAVALSGFGLTVDLIPEGEHGEALGDALSAVEARRILWFTAEKTGEGLESHLNTKAEFRKLACYRNEDISEKCTAECECGFYTSASGVLRAWNALGSLPTYACSIGPACSRQLRQLGIPTITEATEPSYEAMLAAFLGGNHG